MLKVVDVIGVARTGAYEGDASLVTRTKIVRMARLGSGRCLKVARGAAGCNTPPAEHEGVPLDYDYRLLPLTCVARTSSERFSTDGGPRGSGSPRCLVQSLHAYFSSGSTLSRNS